MSTVVSELRGFFPGRPSWRARRALELMLETVLAGAALLGEMPFLDHLEELRRRLIKCLIALGVGSFVGFLYTAPIMTFLNAPAASSGIHLVAIDGFEVFSVYFKVAAATGICLAAPVLCGRSGASSSLRCTNTKNAMPRLSSSRQRFVSFWELCSAIRLLSPGF